MGTLKSKLSPKFSLGDKAAYERWRAAKLDRYPTSVDQLRVTLGCLSPLDPARREAIVAGCRRANFALYQTITRPSMQALRDFGEQLGLVRFDYHLWAPEEGIVALRQEGNGGRSSYIPYTDRPINWHTDGYYNTPDTAVHGVIMHCVTPAAAGGANWLLDPEMVYIAMRDANPAFIQALMQPDAMTIPANTLDPAHHRPAVSGPVFSLDPDSGTLHMRYTARTRSIEWKNDTVTLEAVAFLEKLLTPPVSFAFRVCLGPGEGIVCNNVLHNREGFSDDADTSRQRLLWRARYRERITGTARWRDQAPSS